MATIQRNSAIIPSGLYTLEIQTPGSSNFVEVPGLVSSSESGGGVDTSESTGIEGNVTIVGRRNPTTITLETRLNPLLTVSGLETALANNTPVTVRVSAGAASAYTPQGTIQIAAAGTVTLASATDRAVVNDGQILRGAVIRTGTTASNNRVEWLVSEVRLPTTAGQDSTMVVQRLDGSSVSAVAATAEWAVGNAGFSRTSLCYVTQLGQLSARPGSEISTTLEFRTLGALGLPTYNATGL